MGTRQMNVIVVRWSVAGGYNVIIAGLVGTLTAFFPSVLCTWRPSIFLSPSPSPELLWRLEFSYCGETNIISIVFPEYSAKMRCFSFVCLRQESNKTFASVAPVNSSAWVSVQSPRIFCLAEHLSHLLRLWCNGMFSSSILPNFYPSM